MYTLDGGGGGEIELGHRRYIGRCRRRHIEYARVSPVNCFARGGNLYRLSNRRAPTMCLINSRYFVIIRAPRTHSHRRAHTTHAHAHTCTHVHTHTYTQTHTRTHTYVHTRTQTRTHTHTHNPCNCVFAPPPLPHVRPTAVRRRRRRLLKFLAPPHPS